MKTKILSLVLFLLTTLGAAAEQTVHVAGSEHGYPLGATSWMLTNASSQGIVSGSIEWKADEKVLVLSNLDLPWVKNGPGLLFKGGGEVTVKVNGYAHIYHKSNAPTVNTHAIQTYSGLRFVGTGNLQLQKGTGMDNCDIKVETSYTHLTIDGPKVICVEGNVTGASDKTTDINVLSGGLEIHASAYRAFKHMAANIRSIEYGSGIGMKQPHGAYLDSDGTLRKMSGEAFKKDDSWVDITKVADYGFSICGYEINETNYDLLDKPSRYFPEMKLDGKVTFNWSDNTLYLDNANISWPNTYGAVIDNRTNGGLKLNVKGNCSITSKSYTLKVGADLEINGTGTLNVMNADGGYSDIWAYNPYRKLTVLTNVNASCIGYTLGTQNPSNIDKMLQVRVDDKNGILKGVIRLSGVSSGGKTTPLFYVRLTDHWGNESKLPLPTSATGDRPYYECKADGRSGAWNRNTNYWYQGPTVINGKTTIYPVEINGRYVTSDNYSCIELPELTNGTLSYNPSIDQLNLNVVKLSSLSSGSVPVIKHTNEYSMLNVSVTGVNEITCYGKCPFLEEAQSVTFNGNSTGSITVAQSGSDNWHCGMIDVAANARFINMKSMKVQNVRTNKLSVGDSSLEIADYTGEYDSESDVFFANCELNNVYIDTSYGWAYYGPLPKGNPNANFLVMDKEQKVKFTRTAPTEYDLKVVGQRVTSLNKDNIAFPGLMSGRLVYVPDEQTLLLNNAYIVNATEQPTFQFEYGNITVNAVGENKIVSNNPANMAIEKGTVTTTGAALKMTGSRENMGGVYLLSNGGLTIHSTDAQGTSSIFEFVDGSLGSNTTLNINSPVQFVSSSEQSKKTISVNTLNVSGIEAKYPYSISGGTVVDADGNAATENVLFVPEGTNPIYPSSITLSAATQTLTKKGSTSQLTADILPATVTDKSLTWQSSDEEVATVDGKGLVKAVGNGVATISAVSVNGTEGTIDIAVNIPDPDVITLDQTSILFDNEGQMGSFITATVGPDDCDKTVTWTSSDEDVVTVSETGNTVLVRRVADEGTATITATTVNGLAATCEVRVHYPKYAEEVTLSERSVRLTAIGQEAKVTTTVGPDDIDLDLLGYYLEKMGDTDVADVEIASDGTLTITAKKEGNMGVVVHATCGGETNLTGAYDHVGILVKPIVTATALKLSMDDNTFYQYGERRSVIVSLTPGDVDSRELQWSTNDKSVATVDGNGVVTSVGEGTCTITAKTTDGSNLEAKQIIYVYNPDDYSIVIPENIGISLTRREMTLFPNQRFEMQATLTPASANTYVKWEVENLEGDGGRVEVFYDEEGAPKETLNAELSAYVQTPSDAVYPIKARVIATALGAAAEPLVRDTCIVTILNDIYFTQANADGIDINYHVIKADPQDMQVELYGTSKVQKVNGEWTTVTVPAIDTETTGTLTVPSSVTYDGQSYWVTTLGTGSLVKNKVEELILPEGLTTVRAGAANGGYVGYDGYLKSVTLPSTIKYIGTNAFSSQSVLKDVYVNTPTAPMGIDEMLNEMSSPSEGFAAINPEAVLHIPYDCLEAYNQMPWSDWFKSIDDGSYLTQDTEENVTMGFHISSEANLTAEVKGKPGSDPGMNVTAIDASATEVTIPSQVGNYTVTSISERAFAELKNLETVNIPESIERIEASAFQECEKLDSVTIYRATPPTAAGGAFDVMDPMFIAQRKLYVPYGCKEAYDVAPWNSWFGTIEEMHEEGYVPDTNTDLADNIIYTQNMEVKAGQKTAVSIRMKNNVPIRAFQFKLFLPNGVEAVKNSKNKFLATLNRERLDEEDEHTLSFAKQKDGSILFLCGSMYDENFAAGDGEIISVPVQVADDLADGNYALTIQQTTMTESDITKFYETSVVKSTITVGEGGDDDYIKGDIDGNGAVNVLDYTGVANYILGETPENFNEKAADIDENGVINVLDYTGVANIILGLDEAAARAMYRASDISDNANVIYLKDLVITNNDKDDYLGQEFELSFFLKSSADIRGFQFDLYLPDGMSAVKTKKGKFTTTWNDDALPEDDEHNLTLASQKDGAVRFLCSSMYDETFTTGDLELLTLKVTIDADMADGQYTMQLKDMILTESDISKHYDTASVEADLIIGDRTVSVAGLRVVKGDTEGYYDLQGRKLRTQPQKGVYIKDGRKVVVR